MDNFEPSGQYYDWRITGKPERPWLLEQNKHWTYKLFLCCKDVKKGIKNRLFMDFDSALNKIREIDDYTPGIPKIVYLVGWQAEGHDSSYPSLDRVNQLLKSPKDDDALTSLRRIIREGRKYNTTISLHINLFDAYKDSPLWEEYLEKDIIAKDKDGKVIWGEEFDGQVSSQISYKQEWGHGLTQKRIDGLLEMIPELIEGKTIHIDAFHGARPLGKEEPISPLLGFSQEEEAQAMRKIYRYFREQGLDVTAEGAGFLRSDPFIGLQPFSWADEAIIADLPDELYCTTPYKAEGDIKDFSHDSSLLKKKIEEKVIPHYGRN